MFEAKPDQPTQEETVKAPHSVGKALAQQLIQSISERNPQQVRLFLTAIQSGVHGDYPLKLDSLPEETISRLMAEKPTAVHIHTGTLEDRFSCQFDPQKGLRFTMEGSNPHYGREARINFHRLFKLDGNPLSTNKHNHYQPLEVIIEPPSDPQAT